MRPSTIRVMAVPGIIAPRPRHGGRDPYVARATDHEAIKAGRLDHDDAYPPLRDGEVIPKFPLDIFQHVVGYVKDGSLQAGDKDTAQYCRVPFVGNDPPKTTAK